MNEIEEFEKRLAEVTGEEFSINDFIEFEKNLVSWNERMNLVSGGTIPHIYERHFLDSAQLYPLLVENGKWKMENEKVVSIADLGAGAGFPSLVLAILAKQKNANIKIEAIESIKKKALFLSHMVKTLNLNVIVRNHRIEAIVNKKYDIITARALKPMNELFKYSSKISHKDTMLIFLKGERVQEELLEAKKYWTFDERLIPSKTSDTGRIVIIEKLRQAKF
ncbi:MAG: 16S rRNA (guanine(527)-N(7))-methyltransferase RsmG [Alphaproteobacteria bacterium]|nr:16S rRNA (guanine(527)-N(7))-methyltransferase RsmG [Alphaproteobacteria bacterium]MCL2505280.1 16S rRNA (guanine(527)-N(7))-methyltransferase RsmG [Alphaproteobacteria bacterium]